ncbi:hypothetical protein BN874_550018 [Candidatus Contendobacter odensis Run_B_J11]|uniref:Uncharacterized protein n=1 Tax=Candidatus Contendobacter odensis Run_B_J11 TaxID=1400861 RepID=A0A7U7J3Y1_9GAMM|nr:hypothetical protein BN874_550018 [Candidatus Contendobacter odensis Run_B_J11]
MRVASTTRLGFNPKVTRGIRLKVMIQVLLNPLFRHISDRHAKIAARPKMPSPVKVDPIVKTDFSRI